MGAVQRQGSRHFPPAAAQPKLIAHLASHAQELHALGEHQVAARALELVHERAQRCAVPAGREPTLGRPELAEAPGGQGSSARGGRQLNAAAVLERGARAPQQRA